MIRNKKDLQTYLAHDKLRNMGDVRGVKYIIHKLFSSEQYMAYSYLKVLRHLEYAQNCKKQEGLVGRLIWAYWKFRHHRNSIKYDISIAPNMVGYGFKLPHIVGGGIIINCVSIGNNCGANVGVVVGIKSDISERPIIGDNVTLCAGCKVIGKITVGNNVVIAPNSVVIHDVPNDCAVSGIPAKIIKYYNR